MREERAGLIVKVTEDKQLERVLDVIGSSEIMDRDGEVINADGWQLDNYRKNPVVLFAHNHREPPVAKALRVSADKGQLRFKLQFPTMEEYGFADTLYKLYRGGYMNAVSVGFLPKKWEHGKKPEEPYRTFLEQELLELSLVPIPSNPEALITSRGIKSAIADRAIDEAELEELKAILGRIAEKIEGEGIQEPGARSQNQESRIQESGARSEEGSRQDAAPTGVITAVCSECGEELACPRCSTKAAPSYIEELLRDLGTPGHEPTGESGEKSDDGEPEEELIGYMITALRGEPDVK